MNATAIPRVRSVRLPSRSTPKIAATLFSRDFVRELIHIVAPFLRIDLHTGTTHSVR